MPHHASGTMGPRSGTVRLWARVWVVWGWCFSIGGSAVAIPADLTTEPYIFTGPTTTPPPPPPPPKDFEITYEEVFASFVHLTISYNATLNFTKIHVMYKDPVDSSRHFITLHIGSSGIDPYTLFEDSDQRLGFRFKLGGFYRRKRYNILFVGFKEKRKVAAIRLNFLTGDDDGEDNIYNLTGIFLVVGISVIIMVVVMVCAGYEKLFHEKGNSCCSYLRRKDKALKSSSISPEPLMGNDNHGFDESSTSDLTHRY